MLQNLPNTGVDARRPCTYDLWLDSQDRFARFKMLIKKRQRQVTATYSDYGADVHVAAPDPSDVIEMPGVHRLT